MNEQLQLALTEILNSAIAAKDFLVSEAPLVIQELLTWKLTWSLSMGLVSFAFMVTAMIVAIKTWRLAAADDYENIEWFFATAVSSFVGTIAFFAMIDYLKWAVMITIAPKIYLIEYAAWLIK